MPSRVLQFVPQAEPVGHGYYGHGHPRSGFYGKHEYEDGKLTKSSHGYFYGHNRNDDDWNCVIGCFAIFFLVLVFMPLLFYKPYGYNHKNRGYGCPCNEGYGYMTLGESCGCNSPNYLSAQLLANGPRGAIPDRHGKCSPGEVLWYPPNTNELPRCVLEARGANGSHPAMVDQSINACNNFYQHASGKWLQGAPRDVGRFFGDAAATAANIQRTIDTVEMARTWDHDRLGAMEDSCLATYAAPSFTAEQGAFDYAKQIASGFKTLAGTDQFDMAAAIGALTAKGLVAPVYVDVQRAPDQPNAWIMVVDAGSTFTTDYDRDTRVAIVDAVMRKQGNTNAILAVEDAIDNAIRKGQEEAGDNEEEAFFRYMERADGFSSHVFAGSEMDRKFEGWSWPVLHQSVARQSADAQTMRRMRHWVRSPGVLREMIKVSEAFSSQDLTQYFEFTVLVQMFEFLPATYGFVPVEAELEQISADVHHIGLAPKHLLPWSSIRRPNWHRTSLGVQQGAVDEGEDAPSILAQRIYPRDMPQLVFAERCARQQSIFMADERNEAFSAVALKSKEQTRVKTLVKEIVDARKQMVRESDELSNEGREAILNKLESIRIRVGHAPKRVRGAVSADAPYWRNVANIREMEAAQRFAQVGQDAAEVRGNAPFLMPTNAINAYYDPTDNTISVLAGITLYPFFSSEYDEASAFATLGTIVGHEIGHATDAFGIRFDNSGALTHWLPETDGKVFEESNACFTLEYSGETPETHQFASGRQTVTEAAADNVGIRASLTALKNVLGVEELPQETVAEFGLQFAQMWAVHQSRQNENRQVSYDPHPVASFRVNKAFANTPELLALYNCGTEPTCKLAA
jgi:predicted metalloendopeptidase